MDHRQRNELRIEEIAFHTKRQKTDETSLLLIPKVLILVRMKRERRGFTLLRDICKTSYSLRLVVNSLPLEVTKKPIASVF